MLITTIELNDFRNYKRQSATLCPFVNIIVGGNAQGKTNLLEALYLCSVGKSVRTSKDKELIRMGCDRARVKAVAKKRYGNDSVEIMLDKNANKRVAVNSLPITRLGELMGVVASVFFSPDEMRMVKEGPSDRRRFMDIALSQISRSYFYLLTRYNRIVSQRNKLLKSGRFDENALEVWDAQLSEHGSLIIKTRRGFVTVLSESARRQHLFLTSNKESLNLAYESIEGKEKEEIRLNLLKELMDSRERDLRLGYTHNGPHKDDIGIYIDGLDARKYASQGQQRTAALSIKLAEVDLATKEKGESPVLLLDDVMGELDLDRQKKLLERVRGLQTIITCTHLDPDIISVLGDHKIFNIKNGEIF